ncbi:MAG: site-specific integrase [Firmicutes bacterium]|nr:site-specific integrase [Bacillota bacterium]
MQFFKRGSTWVYRFELSPVGGKRQHEQKGGFKTKAEAEEAGTEALQKYNNTGLTFTPSEISVADYYDLFLKDYCTVNCNKNTTLGYKKRIKNYILPKIGKYRLRSVTPTLLQDLINDMFNRGFSKNTLSTVKGLLSSAFAHAVHPLGLIQYSPAAVIKLPSKRAVPKTPTRKKERLPATKEQFDAIMKRFPEEHPAHLPLLLAHRMGLREGEAFALQYNRDFDFERGIMYINEQVQWMLDEDIGKYFWTISLPKYDSVRQAYMDSELTSLIKRIVEKHIQNKVEYGNLYTRLFVNDKKQIVAENTGTEIFLLSVREDGTFISPRTITHALRVIHYELGIKGLDYHSLRHTHATTLDTNGASMLDISDRLGHCHMKTTKRYLHNNAVLQERTRGILENLYTKKDRK